MKYPELDIFRSFRQVIVWGFPLHSHTHSYIHGAWVKTFQYLGIPVHWFHDKDYPRDFDYTNTCFITEGWADENIPVEASSTYFVHIAKNPAKYLSKGARLIEIRYNVLEIHDFNYDYSLPRSPIYLSKDTLYENVPDDSAVAAKRGRPVNPTPYEAIYMYWATDLLPHEFNYEDASASHTNNIYYMGSLGHKHPFHEFRTCASAAGFNVVHNNPWSRPLSYEDNTRLMKESYCCPDFRSHGDADKHAQYGRMNGTNHVDIGYIPCRVLKAISYGHTGITNSPRVKEILGDFVEYAAEPRDVLPIVERRKNDVDWRRACMKHIAENHTYLQRVRDLARALMMRSTPITMVSAIYDIGRASVDGRDMYHYKEWLLKTMKSIREPFILYMDNRLGWKNDILDSRRDVGPIKIIETDISEICMWKYKDRIHSVLNNPVFRSLQKHPRDITNLLDGYCMIQYSKFGFLEEAITQNLFNSSYFSWIDAGFSRFIDVSKMHMFNPSRCSGDYFHIQGDQPLQRLNEITYDNYIGTNTCILHGWLWVMQASSFRRVRDEVMRVFEEEMLAKDRIDNEQIALGLSCKNNPDLFKILISHHSRWGPASIFDDLFVPIA